MSFGIALAVCASKIWFGTQGSGVQIVSSRPSSFNEMNFRSSARTSLRHKPASSTAFVAIEYKRFLSNC